MKRLMHIVVAVLSIVVVLGLLPACTMPWDRQPVSDQNAAQQASGDQEQAGKTGDGTSDIDNSGQSQSQSQNQGVDAHAGSPQAHKISRDGSYTSRDDVAAYIHEYGRLPRNFISKTKAKKAGWVPSKGNLQNVCPGMSIGGSRFYNDDGLLPDKPGRDWTECDIDYHGGRRGAKRIVFSDDGLIFYTADHYKSFTRLY